MQHGGTESSALLSGPSLAGYVILGKSLDCAEETTIPPIVV